MVPLFIHLLTASTENRFINETSRNTKHWLVPASPMWGLAAFHWFISLLFGIWTVQTTKTSSVKTSHWTMGNCEVCFSLFSDTLLSHAKNKKQSDASHWRNNDIFRWICDSAPPTGAWRVYLEPVGAVEPSQRIPEGQRYWKLASGCTQLLAGHVQLFFIQRNWLIITHSAEVSQVPSHDSRLQR